MTEIKSINEILSVSYQIDLSDLDAIHTMGVTTIIMNRPDYEEESQPETAPLKAKAAELGIIWVDIPVISGQFTLEAIEATADILQKSGQKTHAFCRTGTRSTFLWGLAEALSGDTPLDEIERCARAAGYDLTPARPMMEDLRARQSG